MVVYGIIMYMCQLIGSVLCAYVSTNWFYED